MMDRDNNIYMQRIIVTFVIFLCGFIAKSQPCFEGVIIFCSSSIDDKITDTAEYYYSSSRILLIHKTIHNLKRQTTRRIVDIRARKQYWINDREKVALESDIENEYPKRNFKITGVDYKILEYDCKEYSSDMTVTNSSTHVENKYKVVVLVSGSLRLDSIPGDLYLVNFRVFKSNLILDYKGEYFFGNMQKDAHTNSKLISIARKNIPSGLFEIGNGYNIESYTPERFEELFTRLDEEEILEGLNLKMNRQ